MLFFQSSLSTLARARNKDSRFKKRGREGGREGDEIVVQESAEEEGRQGLESSSKYHAPQQNHIINSVSMCGYCTVKHFYTQSSVLYHCWLVRGGCQVFWPAAGSDQCL